MKESQKDAHEHTLLDRFDDILDDFHAWLWDIKHRRHENIIQLEAEDLEELTKEVAHVQKSKDFVALDRSSLWNFWIAGWIIALASYFIFQSLDLLYLVITWIILSMASEKFIRFFQIWIPRWLSIVIVYLLLVFFLFGWVVLVIPFLITQTAELSWLLIDWALVMQNTIQEQWLSNMIQWSILPDSLKNNIAIYLEGSNLQQSLQSALVENISQIVTTWSSYVKNAGDFAVTLLTNTFSALFQIAVVFTIAVFSSIEKEWVSKFIASLSSTPHHMDRTVNSLYDTLWNRLVGQILLSVAIGLLVGIWLLILDRIGLWLPSSFTLALIAWLTEFIPYLWPILWSIPGIFVASLAYWFKGFIAAWILYMVVQWTENNILVPLIMSQTLWVSPLLIFVTMVMLWSLLWLLWVIIAVPIAVILNIAYKEYLKRWRIKKSMQD